MLVTSIFSFSLRFLPFPRQISIFQLPLFCHLQMLWISTNLKFCSLVTFGAAENIMVKGKTFYHKPFLMQILLLTNASKILIFSLSPAGWLSGERVGLMTWWLWVRDPVQAKFFSGIFSPVTSAEGCEESSLWLWKEICVSTCERKPGNTCASLTAMIWL